MYLSLSTVPALLFLFMFLLTERAAVVNADTISCNEKYGMPDVHHCQALLDKIYQLDPVEELEKKSMKHCGLQLTAEHCTITIGCSKSWGPTMTLWEIYKLATNAVHLCAARHPFRGAEAKIDNFAQWWIYVSETADRKQPEKKRVATFPGLRSKTNIKRSSLKLRA